MGKSRLETKGLDRILRQAHKGDITARTGFFEDSGEHPRSGATAYEIASINNNGTTEIPERPFMTDGAFERELQTAKALKDNYVRFQRGTHSLRQAIKDAANHQEQGILAYIALAPMIYQDNAQSTIDRKGFNAPLHEQGWLPKQIDTKISYD